MDSHVKQMISNQAKFVADEQPPGATMPQLPDVQNMLRQSREHGTRPDISRYGRCKWCGVDATIVPMLFGVVVVYGCCGRV